MTNASRQVTLADVRLVAVEIYAGEQAAWPILFCYGGPGFPGSPMPTPNMSRSSSSIADLLGSELLEFAGDQPGPAAVLESRCELQTLGETPKFVGRVLSRQQSECGQESEQSHYGRQPVATRHADGVRLGRRGQEGLLPQGQVLAGSPPSLGARRHPRSSRSPTAC